MHIPNISPDDENKLNNSKAIIIKTDEYVFLNTVFILYGYLFKIVISDRLSEDSIIKLITT
ncbi:hypothetical protein GCM10007855_05460 [Aliivibrio sifiae]|uniref:Uncharacterized protein n=1 Tax=Aliivibrio sifiae TaxID=566293 RepID=A0ABQ6AG49_9GAMM|nr:hypothetical protein GCM10007855_05460 [Aliivibrio sifiae]